MAKKTGYYSTVPHVPQKKIADINPVGSVSFGATPPHMVPAKPGTIKGFGEKPKPHHYGHGIHQHKGALRVSGHVSAHQVGWRQPHVHKPPPAGHPHKAHMPHALPHEPALAPKQHKINHTHKIEGPHSPKLPKLPKL